MFTLGQLQCLALLKYASIQSSKTLHGVIYEFKLFYFIELKKTLIKIW